MSLIERLKHLAEQVTGIGKPARRDLARLKRRVRPAAHRFGADGTSPNNERYPVLIYRAVLRLDERFDPAAIFETVFAANGWRQSWRDGIYPFRHFHTRTHEVLGIARGTARIELGGRAGRRFDIEAGDVIVLPAGVSHRRIAASKDLLVVGSYPGGGDYDEPRAGEVDIEEAAAAVRKVRKPAKDPVFGTRGPLTTLWRARA